MFFLFRYSKECEMTQLSIRKAAKDFNVNAYVISEVTDRWEMSSANIELKHLIGKGAFGQVYTADVPVNKLSPMYKQLMCEKIDGNIKQATFLPLW